MGSLEDNKGLLHSQFWRLKPPLHLKTALGHGFRHGWVLNREKGSGVSTRVHIIIILLIG